MLKFLVCLLFVARISCAVLGEPGLNFDHNSEYASNYDNYKPRDYHFDYAVSDPHTGDHKSQWEVKENGVVRGGYSLLEPDGTTRIVEYIADDHGFRAVVKKLGTSLHPEHIETHGHVEPEIVQAVPESSYQSYDGQVDNYANVLGAALQHLEPISYQQPIEIPHSVELHGYKNLELAPQPLVYQQEQVAPIVQKVEYDSTPILGHHEIQQIQPLVYKQEEIAQTPVVYKSYPAYSEISQDQGGYGGYNEGLNLGQQYKIIAQPQAIGYSDHARIAHDPARSSQHYYGVTNNPEDDSRYTNYGNEGQEYGGYHGAYSENVQKVVAAPSGKIVSKEAPTAQKFVIYYPGLESYK